MFIRSMNLYSRSRFLASAVLVLVCAAAVTTAFAQRRKAHKLRATAVVEVTTDSAGIVTTHVFPVAILDEGSFHDASIYKSAPRPMALDNGIVYEAQKDGIPVGYATILSSTNNKGWTALGKWQVADQPKKAQAPAPVTTGEDRPIIHRGDANPSATPASTPAPGSDSTTSSSASAPSNDSSSAPDDADRPVLRRRSPPQPEAASTPQPSPTPSTQNPAEGSPAPRTKLPVITPGTKTYVAVSDNESADVRSFAFKWKPGEEQQMEARMRKLALAQLPRENAQLNTGSLQNVVMRSFDLDLSNDAVIVLSAEIPGSYLAPGGGKSAPGKFVSRYVTVIARVDFEGVPQKLASSVTDSSRLDVAPRLELIDAVDVDGDGLAELLFREYSFDEKSFIIYGVGRSTVTKVFEGASMPLK